ncbi:MAG TPA: hypothetical protein VHB20_12535 [Verrucomicrobiae bacterium]|jgi:hypothetical protein|nr:hypothetical protein [Verrucomicrobiae bacterium]
MPEQKGETTPPENVKFARILDEEDEALYLEYPIQNGTTTVMRLEADTFEKAVREAKSFLGIDEENRDEQGNLWQFD